MLKQKEGGCVTLEGDTWGERTAATIQRRKVYLSMQYSLPEPQQTIVFSSFQRKNDPIYIYIYIYIYTRDVSRKR